MLNVDNIKKMQIINLYRLNAQVWKPVWEKVWVEDHHHEHHEHHGWN